MSYSPSEKKVILQEAEAFCEKNGIRLTAIRRQVLSIILDFEDTIKAYDVLNQLKKVKPNATPPTVYRAMDFLVEIGILHKAESLNAFVFCAQFTKQHMSVITNCKICGKTKEIIDENFSKHIYNFVKNNQLTLSDTPIVISVICNNCRGNTHEHYKSSK